MTAFCIGTFAELAPHRWFGLWHSLIAMKPWVQLLGCKELHNACAIQCTNKRIFLGPQMTQETDTRKGLHLTKHPFQECAHPEERAHTPKDGGLWRTDLVILQLP